MIAQSVFLSPFQGFPPLTPLHREMKWATLVPVDSQGGGLGLVQNAVGAVLAIRHIWNSFMTKNSTEIGASNPV